MLNLNNIPHDRAGYGSRVWLKDMAKASEIEYKLVTSEEADAAQGLISTTSPIGRALLGRREGDEVQVQTPAGLKEFELVRLKTIHEDA
jgi:transcription elongation factor GreA